MASSTSARLDVWLLREYSDSGPLDRVVHVSGDRFRIGRRPDSSLCIPSTSVSKQHAELRVEDGRLSVRDLGSTNGTFVNGRRVSESPLAEGDLLQLADHLFRVARQEDSAHEGTVQIRALPKAETLLEFERLMSERAVVPHFQPIVAFDDRRVTAHESLARSRIEGLENPAAMFEAATCLGQESALSEMLRHTAAERAAELDPGMHLFVNTHPKELGEPRRLAASLIELRRQTPDLPITLEIHEAAVSDAARMGLLRELLNALDIGLAYDDFGAGQARLNELAEAPPDVLKFDMQLIRGIDQGPDRRRELLRSLVGMVREFGVAALAEGVETEAEHEACRELGFTHGQGYLYGRPAPTL